MKGFVSSLILTGLVGCSAGESMESDPPEPDHSIVGVAPGTNPALSAEQQVAAFQSLQHATSVHFPRDMNRKAMVTPSDIRNVVAKLSMTPLAQQPQGESRLCLTFTLPNGTEIPVHVWPKYWSFTGGPRRQYHGDLWHYLGLNEKEE